MAHSHTAHSHNAHDAQFGFRVFYGKPRLHQDWDDEQVHRPVTWTELFFDLFYVVASINLGHLIVKGDVWHGVGQMALYYLLFWFTWSTHTRFATSIKLPGLLYDLWQLAFMLSVFSMVVTCSDTKHHHNFSAALAATRLLMALAYAVTALTLPRARQFAATLAILNVLSGVVALISAFTSLEVFYGLMGGVLLVDMSYVPVVTALRQMHLPLHVDHVSERYGLIMIIFLGESIVGLGLQLPNHSAEQWLALLFGVILVWNLHSVYYHVHPGQHFHAMRIHRYRGLAWSFLHAGLGFLFLCLGAALRLTGESYLDVGDGGAHRRRALLAGGGGDKKSAATDGAVKEGGKYDAVHHVTLGILDTDTAWLLSTAYALSFHTCFAIRATHFFTVDPNHWWPNSLAAHNLQWFATTWWLFGFFWPFAAYFFAFSHHDLHGAWLLAVLAAHGLLLIIGETCLTDFLVKHDGLQATVSQALVKVMSERSIHKSSGKLSQHKHGSGSGDKLGQNGKDQADGQTVTWEDDAALPVAEGQVSKPLTDV